jgi:TRAP-type C4-dicarboxylate transport system permease large subunit
VVIENKNCFFNFITSLVFLFTGKVMAQGGIEEELFTEAFPELQGELKFDPNITDFKT